MGSLHEDLRLFMIASRWIIAGLRNVSDKNCRENQNTHFMFNNFFWKSWPLWNNVEKYNRSGQATEDNIIRRMRFAWWISESTNTLRICNNYCFTTVTVVTRTRLNDMFYIHCLSCWCLLVQLRHVFRGFISHVYWWFGPAFSSRCRHTCCQVAEH